MTIYEKIVRGVKWHAFESITYQILLFSHRFALYKVMGPSLFGALGCIFASVYALVFLGSFGFNDSLIAFFSDISSNKNSCKHFFIQQGIPHVCLLITIPICLWILPISSGISALSFNVFIIAGLLFIAESLRIMLRILLQLTFINKELACIDLIGLCTYLAFVWSLWLYGVTLTPWLVLAPLACISCIQVIILSMYSINWYTNLPDNEQGQPLSYKRIMRVRFFSYTHHALSSQFMSNFIVPYSAYIWGLEYASLTKLLVSVSQLITTILKHTVGFSSLALFSHFKHAPHAEKQSIFQLINRFLFGSLFVTIFLCGILYSVFKSYIPMMQTHTALIVLLLCVLTLENLFITCESAYLSEERPDTMAIMYALGAGVLYTLFYYQATNHILLLALSFLTVRLLSLGALTIILTQRWKN